MEYKKKIWIVSEKQETLGKIQKSSLNSVSIETSSVHSLSHKMCNIKIQMDESVKYTSASRIQQGFWANFKYMWTYWSKKCKYTEYE